LNIDINRLAMQAESDNPTGFQSDGGDDIHSIIVKTINATFSSIGNLISRFFNR